MYTELLSPRDTQFGQTCLSPFMLPGEAVDISEESGSVVRLTHWGRIVEVPENRALYLAGCRGGRGGSYWKIVSDDCQFVTPNNDDEWEVVKPILKELAQRGVFVLTEFNLPAIKEKCRQSYYSSSDGTLINEVFGGGRIAPEKMGELGLMFAGDASKQITKCYFDPTHQLRDWTFCDWHEDIYHDRCHCMEDKMLQVPALSTKDGQSVPVLMYDVNMPPNCPCLGRHILVTHPGAPIKICPLSEVMSKVDAATLVVVDASIPVQRETGKNFDHAHFELLMKSIYLSDFSGLLRHYEGVYGDFTTQFREYKKGLNTPADHANADNLLKELASCSVVTEVEETVRKLATLQLVKENAIRLDFLPAATNESIGVGMELVAINDLQELADSYEQKYFVDDCLNELVTRSTFGCVSTGEFFGASERNDERLMSLSAKATELLQVLGDISEAIKKVLKPFAAKTRDVSVKVNARSLMPCSVCCLSGALQKSFS